MTGATAVLLLSAVIVFRGGLADLQRRLFWSALQLADSDQSIECAATYRGVGRPNGIGSHQIDSARGQWHYLLHDSA